MNRDQWGKLKSGDKIKGTNNMIYEIVGKLSYTDGYAVLDNDRILSKAVMYGSYEPYKEPVKPIKKGILLRCIKSYVEEEGGEKTAYFVDQIIVGYEQYNRAFFVRVLINEEGEVYELQD